MDTRSITKNSYYTWFVFINVSLGTFMATLDSSIVNVALPTMAENFNVELPTLQWIVSAYLLTISSLLLTFGRLADMYGKSKIFSGGFLIFILGSAFCGFSSTVNWLILSRVVQAIGAAMMMANSMGIITDVFPKHMRGRALGTVGTVVAAGSITGPSIGGFLIKYWGWESIFFVNIPIGILGYIAALIILPKDGKKHKEIFDSTGAVLFALGMISLLLGLSLTENFGWASKVTVSLLIGAFILLGIFIWWESKYSYPMVDMSMFRNRIFAAGNLAGLISFVAIFNVTILMPFYLQNILNLNPEQVGIMMTPFPLGMAFIAPLSGWLSDKIGPTFLTVGGMGLAACSIGSMIMLTPESTMFDVAIRLTLFGVAMGLFQSPNNSSVMSSVSRTKLGVAGGIVATMRNTGMVLGIAMAVALFTSRKAAFLLHNTDETLAFMYGYKFTIVTGALLCVVAGGLCLIKGKEQKEINHDLKKEKVSYKK